MLQPVQFVAVPMTRIWGGDRLKSWFEVRSSEPIGEYWVLSGHPNGLSVVSDGPLRGVSLPELTERYPEEFLGTSPQPRFPLLIKFLEASADLSVQVHPDDAEARVIAGDYGKTEAWYVVDCPTNGRVNYGHRFADKRALLSAAQTGRIPDYLLYAPIHPGQLVYVPARTLHALLAGTTVIEIQQTSDITYRVYDWDRVDQDGNRRDLHLDAAGDVMAYPPHSADAAEDVGVSSFAPPVPTEDPVILHRGGSLRHERLRRCPYFTVDRICLTGDFGDAGDATSVQRAAGPTARSGAYAVQTGHLCNPDILVVAEGECTLAWPGGEMTLRRGSTTLVPASMRDYSLQAAASATLLRIYY